MGMYLLFGIKEKGLPNDGEPFLLGFGMTKYNIIRYVENCGTIQGTSV